MRCPDIRKQYFCDQHFYEWQNYKFSIQFLVVTDSFNRCCVKLLGTLKKLEKAHWVLKEKMCREQMPKNNPNKAPVFPKQIINLAYPRKHGWLNGKISLPPYTSKERGCYKTKNIVYLLKNLREEGGKKAWGLASITNGLYIYITNQLQMYDTSEIKKVLCTRSSSCSSQFSLTHFYLINSD